MSSTPEIVLVASPSSACHINTIPYDVIQEIFTRCLPQYPLEKPNYKNVPIVLCHVSQFWRTVALTSPFLWSHLNHIVTIQRIETQPGYAVLKRDVEFIKWWKVNQGAGAPFIRLDVVMERPGKKGKKGSFEAGDALDFVLGFVASGQYVDLCPFFSRQLRKRGVPCLKISTLVLSVSAMGTSMINESSIVDAQSILDCTARRRIDRIAIASPLRRLALNESELLIGDIIVPQLWTSLTHVSTLYIKISLGFWSSLMRAVPNLQWASFLFTDILFEAEPKKFEWCTLPHLASLFVRSNSCTADTSELFVDLYLPALHTLSLDGCSEEWRDHRVTTQIHAILKSAPNVTTLTLGVLCLGMGYVNSRRGYTADTHDVAKRGLEPIWTHAPLLTHLRFELFSGDVLLLGTEQVFNYHSDERERGADKWLALESPTCPIRVVTLITGKLEEVPEDVLDRAREIGDKMAPKVDLRFASTSYHIRGYAGGEWLEWGARK